MGRYRKSDLIFPSGLDWLRGSAIGQSWLNCVPDLIDECAERWELTVGDPFPYAYVSLVMPATTAAGQDVVLKLRYPDHESEHEAEALVAWDGAGAVRLVDQDKERHALLLERCLPGNDLSTVGAATALDTFVGLLLRLWIPADQPFETLAEAATRWAEELPRQWERADRPFGLGLVEAAIDTLNQLTPTQGEQVLLHQDLHAGNVLSAQREPWLAIDPKPLVGEREFGIAPIVRGAELGDTEQDVIGRLDRLSADLGLDRERARGWAFAHTVAWAFENDQAIPYHVAVARWLHACL